MNEEKDIQPIDKLFRQSLEGYTPVPPASVWKGIKAKKFNPTHSSGKWFTSQGGLSVISAVVLVAFSWIIYKSFVADPETIKQNQSESPLLIDSIILQQTVSEKDKSRRDIQINNEEKLASDDNKKTGVKQSGSISTPVSSQASSSNGSVNQGYTINKTSQVKKINTFINPNPVDNSETEVPLKKDIQVLKSKQIASIKHAETNLLSHGQEQNFIDSFVEYSTKAIVTLPSDSKTQEDQVTNKNKTAGLSETISGNISAIDTSAPELLKTKSMVWQTGICGNIGNVYQKDRNANLFYGGMITGGFWNTKWNAGIETGIGLSRYKDYGSVENSWMTNDSIIKTDTIWHQLDSISYYELHDSTIYSTVAHSQTINYHYNYTYLQVPFFITKQIAAFGKFSLDIKAGPLVGFMISKKETITGSMPPENIMVTSLDKNYTRLDISWQLHLSPQLRWNFSDKLSLEISPTAVFYLNNLYDKKNRPASKPYGLSVYGGAIYKFK